LKFLSLEKNELSHIPNILLVSGKHIIESPGGGRSTSRSGSARTARSARRLLNVSRKETDEKLERDVREDVFVSLEVDSVRSGTGSGEVAPPQWEYSYLVDVKEVDKEKQCKRLYCSGFSLQAVTLRNVIFL